MHLSRGCDKVSAGVKRGALSRLPATEVFYRSAAASQNVAVNSRSIKYIQRSAGRDLVTYGRER